MEAEQRLLSQSADELVARRFAPATRLRADPAVLVHAGMALTIGCASPAGSPTRFHESLGEACIRTGVTGQDRARCRANIGTVHVGPDALDQFGHHVLGEAGIRARCAGLRAVETCLNAFGQLREIKLTQSSGGIPTSPAHATWRSPPDGIFDGLTIRVRRIPQMGSVMAPLRFCTDQADTVDVRQVARWGCIKFVRESYNRSYQLTGLSSGPTMCP